MITVFHDVSKSALCRSTYRRHGKRIIGIPLWSVSKEGHGKSVPTMIGAFLPSDCVRQGTAQFLTRRSNERSLEELING